MKKRASNKDLVKEVLEPYEQQRARLDARRKARLEASARAKKGRERYEERRRQHELDNRSPVERALDRFGERNLLRLQFSKLVNMHRGDLDPVWGGTFFQADPVDLRDAYKGFYDLYLEAAAESIWVHKIESQFPWGPDNVMFKQVPWAGFLQPDEPYFSVRGVTVRLKQASEVLGVDAEVLLDFKLKLFNDEEVLLSVI